MADYIEIYWTAGNLDEARRICRYLVQERLVASSQIIPWVESIYMWNNRLETVQESKIILKTEMANFEKVQEVITSNCSYEVPEITYAKLDGGSKTFFEWLGESVSPKAGKK